MTDLESAKYALDDIVRKVNDLRLYGDRPLCKNEFVGIMDPIINSLYHLTKILEGIESAE